ncbi:MAG: saccharopine dehydrogenase NADP-binding domain-containing protein [Pseudomonadota bacterium]|nr:saccharopine dehydrogenase NADP-binding domain-containing protein [Pseudomonadota bacterium]
MTQSADGYPVLVTGGYGNFGRRVVEQLVAAGQFRVLVAGRARDKAQALADRVSRGQPGAATGIFFDVGGPALGERLSATGARLVIHTAGPFQGQDYDLARACIAAGIHYLDLADGRDFVAGIGALDTAAAEAKVSVLCGVSTLPALSSVVVDRFSRRFATLQRVRYGIVPGYRAERGAATLRGVLSYVGKPIPVWRGGQWQTGYGWQELHRADYGARLGRHWQGLCDVPDLLLFPQRYPGIQEISFYAGIELAPLHLALWSMSWLVRGRLVRNWRRYARLIDWVGHRFDRFGSADGGMLMVLEGTGADGAPLTVRWMLFAPDGVGPYIPTIPALLLARDFAAGSEPDSGARPALGLFSLERFLEQAAAFAIVDEARVNGELVESALAP